MDAPVALHAESIVDAGRLEVEQARARFDDGRALEIALSMLSYAGLGAVKPLPRCEYDAALSLLKKKA